MNILRDLPNDLVDDIVCYVPATSLKRLRCVCKHWDCLFKDDSRFAREHFDKAAKEFLVLLLNKDWKLCPMSVNLRGIVPSVELKSELTIPDPHYDNLRQFNIARVFHCNGLLLCTSDNESRVVVWNPCTGETRWIDTSYRQGKDHTFVLGYCQDKKSYKILSFNRRTKDSAIYEFSSDSWRNLVHNITPSWSLAYCHHCVSFKGDTFLFARPKTKNNLNLSLLRFDFSSEKFIHVPLPSQCCNRVHIATSLSVVKEEKISVLLQPHCIFKVEIWVTNKIDETKAVLSWSKVLDLDLRGRNIKVSGDVTFLLDEEKKVAVCSETWTPWTDPSYVILNIIEEDSKVTRMDLGEDTTDGVWPMIINYVPSLVQIDHRGKRKRAD